MQPSPTTNALVRIFMTASMVAPVWCQSYSRRNMQNTTGRCRLPICSSAIGVGSAALFFSVCHSDLRSRLSMRWPSDSVVWRGEN
jgi:hypothetical protein